MKVVLRAKNWETKILRTAKCLTRFDMYSPSVVYFNLLGYVHLISPYSRMRAYVRTIGLHWTTEKSGNQW
jgi:hypothetical protein